MLITKPSTLSSLKRAKRASISEISRFNDNSEERLTLLGHSQEIEINGKTEAHPNRAGCKNTGSGEDTLEICSSQDLLRDDIHHTGANRDSIGGIKGRNGYFKNGGFGDDPHTRGGGSLLNPSRLSCSKYQSGKKRFTRNSLHSDKYFNTNQDDQSYLHNDLQQSERDRPIGRRRRDSQSSAWNGLKMATMAYLESSSNIYANMTTGGENLGLNRKVLRERLSAGVKSQGVGGDLKDINVGEYDPGYEGHDNGSRWSREQSLVNGYRRSFHDSRRLDHEVEYMTHGERGRRVSKSMIQPGRGSMWDDQQNGNPNKCRYRLSMSLYQCICIC